jgi:sugar lactone lactonase YvrE
MKQKQVPARSSIKQLGQIILLLSIWSSGHADTLYVSNYGDSTIRKVTSDGVVTKFATVPRAPFGLAFDSLGRLCVASAQLTNKISILDSNGVVATYATLPRAYDATDLAFDPHGILYAGSQGGFGVGRISRGGSATPFKGGFTFPLGLAFDSRRNLYVADANNGRITKIAPDGTASPFAAGLGMTWGIAFDANENLYVAAQNRIRKITPDGTNTVFASLGVPQGLAFDTKGDLFVADSSDDSVKKITPDGTVTKFASGFNHPLYIAIQPELSPPSLSIASQSSDTIAQDGAKLTLKGGLNQFYQILYSSDLLTWNPFQTNQIRANSSSVVIDSNAGTQPGVFYKARLLP